MARLREDQASKERGMAKQLAKMEQEAAEILKKKDAEIAALKEDMRLEKLVKEILAAKTVPRAKGTPRQAIANTLPPKLAPVVEAPGQRAGSSGDDDPMEGVTEEGRESNETAKVTGDAGAGPDAPVQSTAQDWRKDGWKAAGAGWRRNYEEDDDGEGWRQHYDDPS